MSALTDVFTAIANAIRGKNGLSTTYKPNQMAQAITDLPSGADDTVNMRLIGALTNSSGANLVSSDGKHFMVNNAYSISGATIQSIIYDDVTDMYYIGTSYDTAHNYVVLYTINSSGTMTYVTMQGMVNTSTSYCTFLRVRGSGNYFRLIGFCVPTNASTNQYGILISNNGTTWSLITISNGTMGWIPNYCFYQSTYSRYYIFGQRGGKAVYSANGTSWSQATTNLPSGYFIYAYSPTLDRLVALPASSSTSSLYYSTNVYFSAWATVANTDSQTFVDVKWCESISKFVAITNARYIYTSTDGSSWTRVNIVLTGGILTRIDWSNVSGVAKVVITSASADIVITEDGTTWKQIVKSSLSIGYVACKKTYSY